MEATYVCHPIMLNLQVPKSPIVGITNDEYPKLASAVSKTAARDLDHLVGKRNGT